MRALYIESDMGFWVDKEGDHIYHHASEADLCARIRELEAALAKEKGGWDAFYKLRRSAGDARYPSMRHEVTCKLFPDPFDEREPVGPCTCSPSRPDNVSRGSAPSDAGGKSGSEA